MNRLRNKPTNVVNAQRRSVCWDIHANVDSHSANPTDFLKSTTVNSISDKLLRKDLLKKTPTLLLPSWKRFKFFSLTWGRKYYLSLNWIICYTSTARILLIELIYLLVLSITQMFISQNFHIHWFDRYPLYDI